MDDDSRGLGGQPINNISGRPHQGGNTHPAKIPERCVFFVVAALLAPTTRPEREELRNLAFAARALQAEPILTALERRLDETEARIIAGLRSCPAAVCGCAARESRRAGGFR